MTDQLPATITVQWETDVTETRRKVFTTADLGKDTRDALRVRLADGMGLMEALQDVDDTVGFLGDEEDTKDVSVDCTRREVTEVQA